MFVKEITVMSFENYFPVWNELNTAHATLDRLGTATGRPSMRGLLPSGGTL